MKAELVLKHKDVTPEGHIIEMTIWSVPAPVVPSSHAFKYSLVYIVDGKRVIGFDNERGKGDHCHLDNRQINYSFTDIEQLVKDFILEVEKARLK